MQVKAARPIRGSVPVDVDVLLIAVGVPPDQVEIGCVLAGIKGVV
jgi:hypothetical protein